MLDPWIIEEIRKREEERRRRQWTPEELPLELPLERPPKEQIEDEDDKPWEPNQIDIGGGDDETESRSYVQQFDI